MRSRNIKSQENSICAKNIESPQKMKNLKMYCICHTKKTEIRNNVDLAIRAQNLKSQKHNYIKKSTKTQKYKIHWNYDIHFKKKIQQYKNGF